MADFILAVLHVLLSAITIGGWGIVLLIMIYDGYPWLAWRDLRRAGRWIAGEQQDGVGGDAKPSLRIIDGAGAADDIKLASPRCTQRPARVPRAS